MKSRRLKL